MKQLLLRVPEELHARLSTLARRQQRSVNALANDVLDAHTRDGRSSREMFRARARAAGVLAEPVAAKPVSAEDRARALDATRGKGPILDELLEDGR